MAATVTAEVRVLAAADLELEVLRPLWLSLHDHHAHVAPHLGAIKSHAASWQVRCEAYRTWSREDGCFVVLAEDGGAAIGYAFVRVVPGESATWEVPARVGVVETLAVLPSARRTGVGQRLVDSAFQQLRDANVAEVSLDVMSDNASAVAFYKTLGFDAKMVSLRKML